MTLTLTHFYHITICFANPVYQLNPEGIHDLSIILVLIMPLSFGLHYKRLVLFAQRRHSSHTSH